MKITTQKQLDDLIATADEFKTIVLDEDLEITFNCEIPCSIQAWNIKAHNIKAHEIIAYHNIKAYNIYAKNIYAKNIVANFDINARNIIAHNIIAHNIYAWIIQYHAFCIAYESLKCNSISGRRKNSIHKCLDQEIEIIKEEEKVTIELTESQLDKIKHLI
jgi:hypothetical protein